MAVPNSVDPNTWLVQQIQQQDPDLLRSMVKTMAETLMPAGADGLCGAEYGERTEERANRRNGYRTRDWDTRAGTVAVAFEHDLLKRRIRWSE
ncbi:transposase [Streptosporangium algeriense]|uniref:Transposase n=1 Tax=Streptosporangium algeriense TaxID=1682748 RepID=A0ABW3DL61_9ACTN